MDGLAARLQDVIALSPLAAGPLAMLVAAALVAGLARGFSGFGAALILIPVASAIIGPLMASPMLLVVDGILTIGMVPDAWRKAERRHTGAMALGALVGVPAGTAVLTLSDPLVLRWVISGVVVLLLVFLASGWRYAGRPKPVIGIGVGAVAGLFSGAAQLGGAPVVAYLLGGTRTGSVVRANVVLFFAISTLITLVSYLKVGNLLTVQVLLLALITAPCYGLGLFAGSRLFGIASDVTFRRICYSLIAIAAVVGLPLFDGLLR